MLPFLFWGDDFTAWFSGQAAIDWLRGFGAWGWLILIGLLIGDLFLPIPATPLMSAAGFLYGPWLGGLLSAAGSFLSGLLAYGLCRQFGQGIALRLVGAEELRRGESLFRHRGPWLVALSRWLPLFPEVIACLAGLAKMPLSTFAMALGCGCVPMGFVYAWVGAAGQENPRLALALSAVIPALLWAVLQWGLRKWHPSEVGSRRSEVGDRGSEVGSRRSEVGSDRSDRSD